MANGGLVVVGGGRITTYDSSGRQTSAAGLENQDTDIQLVGPDPNPGVYDLAGGTLEWSLTNGRTDGFPPGVCGHGLPFGEAGPVARISSGFAALQGSDVDAGSATTSVIVFKDQNGRPDERVAPGGSWRCRPR